MFVVGCAALAMLVFGFLIPDWRANHSYLPNTCVVLAKRLDQRMSEGESPRPVYHPSLKIRHAVEGRSFELWTYDAIPMYGPDQAANQAILDGFAIGATYPCWYDPDRPERAILVRGHAWVPYLLLVVPLLFLTIGGAGMRHRWKNRAKAGPAERLGRLERARGFAQTADSNPDTAPTLDLSGSPGSTLRYRLPTSTTPKRNLAGCVFITLVINTIAAVGVAIVVGNRFGLVWARSGPPWPLQVAIGLAALLGLAAIGVVITAAIGELMIAARFGPTIVEISTHPLVPGARFEIFLSQTARRNFTVNALRVLCVCEEESRGTGDENAATRTSRVYEAEIVARRDLELQAGLPLELRSEFRLPPGAMPSFKTADSQVRWNLVVEGDVPRCPNLERRFPIVVEPCAGDSP
jgi:hypothetical protein